METVVVDKVIIDLTHVGDEIRVTQRQIPFQQGDIIRIKPDSKGFYFSDSKEDFKILSDKRNYKVIGESYDIVLIQIRGVSCMWVNKDSILKHTTQLNIKYED